MKTIFLAILFLLPSVLAYAVPTAISVQEISETAAAPTETAADTSNGNSFLNNEENVFLRLKNTDGANAATVTIAAQDTAEYIPGFGNMSKSDIAVALTAGQIKMVGPFPRRAFNTSAELVTMVTAGTGAASVKITPMKVRGLIPKR